MLYVVNFCSSSLISKLAMRYLRGKAAAVQSSDKRVKPHETYSFIPPELVFWVFREILQAMHKASGNYST